MTTPIPIAFHWSGGKDSAHALGRLLRDERYDVRGLVSTIHGADPHVSVHDVPVSLIKAQADAIGLPLHRVALSGPGLEDYAPMMERAARDLRASGVRAVGFGDLEHSGALAYRQELFGRVGLEVVEPLWGMTARSCMEQFLSSGIVALTVVVNADVLGRDQAGVLLDRDFLDALPDGCDPCGELGEYHSFVVDAPYFTAPVRYRAAPEPTYLERRIGTRTGVRTFRYWRRALSGDS